MFTTSYELELVFFHFADVKSGIHGEKMPKVTSLENRKPGNQIYIF